MGVRMKRDKLSLKTNILKEIFNIAPKKFRENDKTDKFLAKKFKISEKEAKDNLEFLFEMYLIKKSPVKNYKKDRSFNWEITDKGLDYLEKKEGEKKQENINKTIAFTGSIIALVTIYNFIIANLSFDSYPEGLLIIKLVFLFLLFLCIGPLAVIVINFWKREVFGR